MEFLELHTAITQPLREVPALVALQDEVLACTITCSPHPGPRLTTPSRLGFARVEGECFQNYDPIIQISNNLISKQSKIYHSFKTEFNLNKIKGSDWKRDLMMDIGFLDRPENKKVTHKHAIRNLMEQNEI